MSDAPLDIMGREIKVGDTVVYGTYTRSALEGPATVIDVIPYLKKYKRYDYTSKTYSETSTLEYKIKFEVPTERYDAAAKKYVADGTRKQTLDNPSRFAVVNGT